MAFKDVLKKQRQSGKGLISSLGSSAFDTIREKIDYRNSLFKKGGTLNALFPNVKGFKAGETLKVPKQAKTETEKTIVSMDNTEVVQELSKASAKLDIVGKNTMALPIMMRDMNVMRQGIVKLVKLSGGTQRDKADRFFQTSAQQESLYETKIAKSKSVTATTPTNVKQVPEEKKKGIFDSILDFLPTVFKGLLLTGIIGQLLENDEVRQKVKDFVSLVLTKFFNGVSNSFEVIKESFQNEDVQKSIRTAIGSIISTIGEFLSIKLTTLFDTPFGEVNLTIGGAIAAVIAGFVAFKAAIATLTTAVLQAAGRIGMAGGGRGPISTGDSTGGKTGKGGWLKTVAKGTLAAGGVALLSEGIQYYLKQGENAEDAKKLAQQDIDNQARESLSPGEEISPIPPGRPEGMRGSEMVERAGSAVNSAITIGTGVALMPAKTSPTPSTGASPKPSPAASGKPLTSFGSVGANREMEKNKTLWEKITKVIRKAFEKGVSSTMLSKIYSKFGFTIAAKISAAIAGIVAAPFSVGVSLLITAIGVGMLAKDVYDLYEWFVEYEKELDAYEKSSSPTPTPITANIENPVDAMGNVIGSPSSPPTAVQGRSTMKDDPRRTDKAPSTSPTPSTSYSEVVGKSESGGNYDTVYGQPGNAKINGKPVTQNTIGEVIEWQNKMRSSNRHAAGKYQFINVADAANNAGLSTTALFDGINQELMQKVFTERNAKALKQSGIEPTNENLGLAHSVGAAGASKLLQAQQSGQGNLIAADVLGLKGAARDTNPHLMKPVSQVIASNESKFNGVSPSGVNQPPTTMVAQAPSAPTRPAAQIASASTSLADTMRSQMQTPVVINAPTTNNNMQNAGNGGQRSTTTPSIVDSELMKLLVERVAA